MRWLTAIAALTLTIACDSPTESGLQLSPSDVSVEGMPQVVPAGTATTIRFTNHTDIQVSAAALSARIDIWPDDRLWAISDGRLYKRGGVTLAPGESKVEIIDVVETLPPGDYDLKVDVSADPHENHVALQADVAVTVTPAPLDDQVALVLEVTEASAAAGAVVPVRILNPTESPARFKPFSCSWYDVQQLVGDAWVKVPSYRADACFAVVDEVLAGEAAERSLTVPATATSGTFRFAVPFILGDADPAESIVFSNSFEVP